jgi:hypothetical protein
MLYLRLNSMLYPRNSTVSYPYPSPGTAEGDTEKCTTKVRKKALQKTDAPVLILSTRATRALHGTVFGYKGDGQFLNIWILVHILHIGNWTLYININIFLILLSLTKNLKFNDSRREKKLILQTAYTINNNWWLNKVETIIRYTKYIAYIARRT